MMKVLHITLQMLLGSWLILAFPFASPGRACEAQWYTAEGRAPIQADDRAGARQAAAEAAGWNAVRQSLVPLTLDVLLADFHLNGNAISPIPFVTIQSMEILEESVMKGGLPEPAGEGAAYGVKLKAALCMTRRDPKADLKLSVALNQPVFMDGDEMQIRIRASHDCHYAIYMVTEDQGVARLIPSRLKKDNRLKADESIVFPASEEMERGIRLRAHVAADGAATTETLFILALRQEQLETDENMDEAVFGLYDRQTTRLDELIGRIAVIPLKHRCVYLVRYAIRPRS